MGDDSPARVAIVGLQSGQWFGTASDEALRRADVVIGSKRHLLALPPDLAAERVELAATLEQSLSDAIERRGGGQSVCMLASGDPGFFGLVRLAAARLGRQGLEVHPAPSSVSLAFARLGDNWDDAAVVSAHGRPLSHAVSAALHHPKVAVLVCADQPAEMIGRALLDAGCGPRLVRVCSMLASPEETITETDLAGLAAGHWDPLSVVVLSAPEALRGSSGPGLSWGLAESSYAHRDGMITKAEVRAVALGKLSLPAAGVLWDIGAGSGSVSAECARLAPGLAVFALECNPSEIPRLRANLASSTARVVQGKAPEALTGLADPDRAFVGGGGIEVLDAVLRRLRPGGTVVATYATLGRASAAAERLGNLVQVSVSRGAPITPSEGTTQWRLEAENPVFVVWGSPGDKDGAGEGR